MGISFVNLSIPFLLSVMKQQGGKVSMQVRVSQEGVTRVNDSLVITQDIHSYKTGPRSSQKVKSAS